MGIQPIDLQMLYTQMDKVGKSQLSQQAAVQQAKDAADADVRKAAEAKAKTVHNMEGENEFSGKVSDRSGGGQSGGESPKKDGRNPGAGTDDENTENPDAGRSGLRGAGIGNQIDISV